MSFADAVKVCLTKYADFSGRARRSEFWYFVLFQALVSLVASILDAILGTSDVGSRGLLGTIASLALLIPSLAVGARRLHDTGRSGWWQLLLIAVIVGWIFLIVWWCQEGAPGDNEHGPNPKGVGAGQVPGSYQGSAPAGPGYYQAPGPEYGQAPEQAGYGQAPGQGGYGQAPDAPYPPPGQ